MPLQDLTPQLRTRLSRLEFVVGLFVTVAVFLLIAGLAYYVYLRAERRGWFLQKLPYFTFVRNAAGLNVGDKVKLMGFDVGEIIRIEAMPPYEYYDVYVQFLIWEPYYGYLWDDSVARVAAADLLGKRSIEVTKGTNGVPTYLFHSYDLVPIKEAIDLADHPGVMLGEDIVVGSDYAARALRPLTRSLVNNIAALGSNDVYVVFQNTSRPTPTGVWEEKQGRYLPYAKTTKGYFMPPDESPALTERLEGVIHLVQTNLPNFLALTNTVTSLLTNAAQAVARADAVLASAQPVVTNLAVISGNLRQPQGSFGDWLFPTNVNTQLTQTLASLNTALFSADQTLTNTDARLGVLVSNLNLSLENLAGVTSNLHAQVQSNTNLVTSLNRTIIQIDEFIQGLRRHWLFRSAFKNRPPPPPAAAPPPRTSPAPSAPGAGPGSTEPPRKRPFKPLRSPRDASSR